MTTDMYASAGDPDLAAMSGNVKQVIMDDKYGQPKSFFHVTTRQQMCQAELAERQIDEQECVEARDFCQKMM